MDSLGVGMCIGFYKVDDGNIQLFEYHMVEATV